MAMAITVKFLGSTNTQPARMRVYSWLTAPQTVNYPSHTVCDGSDIESCARYAAGVALEQINERCKENAVVWTLDQYLETYDGNRHFTLK